VWGADAVIRHVLAPQLVGCDPADLAEIERRFDAVCSHNWFAKAALEMACWDLVGKATGKPVYELLGGLCRPRTFRCRFSMGAYDLDRARRVAAERVAVAFTTIKVKVGGDPPDDIARVRAVRETIGPSVALTVDANCGWDADTAIRALRTLDDCQLALVEQPTTDGDFTALSRVRRAIAAPILADDICFDLADARELVANNACDAISVYPGKNGGLRRSLAIVDYAARHGVACSIGSNLELDVATAAMGHLVVGAVNVQVERYPGDALGPSYHEFSVVREPLEIDGPWVTVPDRAGLGVEVDWQLVRRHLVPE
jgi:muconate cycloisomerase